LSLSQSIGGGARELRHRPPEANYGPKRKPPASLIARAIKPMTAIAPPVRSFVNRHGGLLRLAAPVAARSLERADQFNATSIALSRAVI
jgi:hypothetical protein